LWLGDVRHVSDGTRACLTRHRGWGRLVR
jgi:hypothetical protein